MDGLKVGVLVVGDRVGSGVVGAAVGAGVSAKSKVAHSLGNSPSQPYCGRPSERGVPCSQTAAAPDGQIGRWPPEHEPPPAAHVG